MKAQFVTFDSIDTLDVLTGLVNKNLLKQREVSNAEPRFIMLQTLWEYALEKLQASGEESLIRNRHAGYFVDYAEEIAKTFERNASPQIQLKVIKQAAPEQDNMQNALDWWIAIKDANQALRMCRSRGGYWLGSGNLQEAIKYFELSLNLPGEVAPEYKMLTISWYGWALISLSQNEKAAQVLNGAVTTINANPENHASINVLAVLAKLHENDYTKAKSYLETARDKAFKAGYSYIANMQVSSLGDLAVWHRDYTAARSYYIQALENHLEAGSLWQVGDINIKLGDLAYLEANLDQARNYYEEALKLYQQVNKLQGIGTVHYKLGKLYLRQSKWKPAENYLRESRQLFQKANFKPDLLLTYTMVGYLKFVQGDYPGALHYIQQSLQLCREIPNPVAIAQNLMVLSLIFAANDYDEVVANLKGIVESMDAAAVRGVENFIAEAYSQISSPAKAQSLSLPEIIGFALSLKLRSDNH